MNADADGDVQTSYQFFTEEQTPALHFGLRIFRRLLSKRTAYQQLDILETTEFGRLMALDGKVMLTERDERFYHEMLVHPALLAHEQPRTVLVIGGGDGGTVREVLQHPSIEHVLWVEIDEEVVAASRQYLPSLCAGVFEDPRVELQIMPGENFISSFAKAVDIVIVDSTDPIGSAVPLFQPPFLRSSARALHPDGIYVTQCGTPFFQPADVRTTHSRLRSIFPQVRLYLGFVPSYPAVWSYCMASKMPLEIAIDTLTARYEHRGLRTTYFIPELYPASAVLPRFVMNALEFI